MQPEPISALQALRDLRHNALVSYVLSHKVWSIIISVLVFIVVAVFAPRYLPLLLPGTPLVLMVPLIAYLVSQWRFVLIVQRRNPLCPVCKSPVWQVRCSQCRKPVPILTLLLRGKLLAHCPHCACRLSTRHKTLVGWCHSKQDDPPIPRPDIHFFQRTHVEIVLGQTLPHQLPPVGWEVKENSTFQELHRAHGRIYLIRYCITHDRESVYVIPDEVLPYVRSVWVGRKVNSWICNMVLDRVPDATAQQAELLVEDDEASSYRDIGGVRFGNIRTGVPHPI